MTIFVSTHFMNEAERCDRISLMDAGRVLATDTPAGLVKARGAATLEDAFISYLEEATGAARFADRANRAEAAPQLPPVAAAPSRIGVQPAAAVRLHDPRSARAAARSDPARLRLLGTALLMLVFGFGISTDVNNLSFAVLDRDQSPESRAYLEELRGSTYFVEKAPLANYAELDKRLKSGDIKAAIEIPPRLRPRHQARTPGLGRRLDRWRDAVPRRDDPRLSARHASAAI